MSVVCSEVRKVLPKMPIGIQVLSNGNKEALAIAKAAGNDFRFLYCVLCFDYARTKNLRFVELNFVRAESFVFGHIGDEGYADSCAAELLRYRRNLEANDILVFTDIKKKHR